MTTKTLALVKPPHRFLIRYETGSEAAVLDALQSMVNRGEGFDWFDAAILSHQVQEHLAAEVAKYLGETSPQKTQG